MVLSLNKWFTGAIFMLTFQSGMDLLGPGRVIHPFHVSVIEINHNTQDKTLEISCKIFTDDFEDALHKKFQVKIDLVNPKGRPAMDKLVSGYIHDHLAIKSDNKQVFLNYLGYEVENEAVYAYLQVDNVNTVKKIDLVNTILYDLYNDQTGINHVTAGGNRKSVKLDCPNSQAAFQF